MVVFLIHNAFPKRDKNNHEQSEIETGTPLLLPKLLTAFIAMKKVFFAPSPVIEKQCQMYLDKMATQKDIMCFMMVWPNNNECKP